MTKHLPKTVLITGAAVRLGAHIAQHLAMAGWSIAIHCHRSRAQAEELAKKIQGLGVKAIIVQGDLRDEGALMALLNDATQALNSPLTCLINNAALFEKDNLENFTSVRLQAHMEINLRAPLILSRHFAAQLPADMQGSIINILDGSYGWSLSPNYLSYTLSKESLRILTTLLAQELAPRIRVNAVSPGPTLPGSQDKPDTFEHLQKRIPLQRTVTQEEISKALEFLLATPSITGETISLAGGLNLPYRLTAVK